MSPREQALRRRWFDAGADALERACRVELDDGYARVYACPLCWQMFGEESLLPPPELTIEHVPPQSLGGRPLVLTCASCNHTAGSKVDADAATYERHKRTIRGNGGIVPMRIDGGVTAEMELGKDGRRVFVDPARSDPAAMEALFRRLDDIARDDSGTMPEGGHRLFDAQIKWGYDPLDVMVSHLRAGYLVVFALFGYKAVLAPAYTPLRALLRDLDGSAVPVVPVLQTPGGPVRVVATTHDQLGETLVIQMGEHAAVLPSPLEADESWWQQLEGVTGETRSGRTIPWPTSPQHSWDHNSTPPGPGEGTPVDLFGDDP